MPTDVHITTRLLYQGALLFALMDAIYVPLLTWRVNKQTFLHLKWWIAITAGAIWFAIWSWAIGNYWDTVYSYVFPAWSQTWSPWIALAAGAAIGLGIWSLAIRLRSNPVLTYCLAGGMLGIITHIWAVTRGIVTRPPILLGASPLAAVIVAFFEYIFYWCTILAIAAFMEMIHLKVKHPAEVV